MSRRPFDPFQARPVSASAAPAGNDPVLGLVAQWERAVAENDAVGERYIAIEERYLALKRNGLPISAETEAEYAEADAAQTASCNRAFDAAEAIKQAKPVTRAGLLAKFNVAAYYCALAIPMGAEPEFFEDRFLLAVIADVKRLAGGAT